MKKFLVILLLSINLYSITSAENNTWETSTWNTQSWTILEITSATTWSWENALVNPVENRTITYYYWETCPYCQKLNLYLTKTDWYNKLNIDKREVWRNKQNSLKMTEDLKRLWLENDSSIWVPFLVVNENWKEITLSGLDQAMAYFEPILWKVEETSLVSKENILETTDWKTNNNAVIFLVSVLLLAVIIPLLFIKKSK